MKKIIGITLALALILSLAACGTTAKPTTAPVSSAAPAPQSEAPVGETKAPETEAPQEVIHFKLGTANNIDSPQQKVAEAMNELLAERLPKYTIDIHPSGQLGGERDLIESVQMESLDLAVTATTPLANFVPSLGAGELLYLIQDYEQADAVYQGEIGARWLKDMEASNIKGLGFAEVGFRQLCTSNFEVNSIEDAKDIKLRVMENQIHVAGWKALGIDAITMGWADAYAGVQQGTIDALENPWCLIMANSVYEVCKDIAETNHIYTAQAFMMSMKAWNSLTPEEQEIWQQCAAEACQAAIEYNRTNTENFKSELIALGITITQPDVSEWEEMAKKLYDDYDSEYGDDIRAIQALASK